MSVHKVLEILVNSDKSWEDAANKACVEASKTVRNVESVYVSDLSAKVDNGKIVEWRLNAKVTFKVESV